MQNGILHDRIRPTRVAAESIHAMLFGIFVIRPGLKNFEAGLKAFGEGDFETGLSEIKPLAEKGHIRAQQILGGIYYVAQDYGETLKWFQLAAEQGDPPSQYYMGLAYCHGWGIPKDYREAVNWFQCAANQDDVPSQYYLGLAYYFGWSVLKDYIYAAKWFRKAAEQGYKEAQFNLGVMYALGEGIKQNLIFAHAWINLAAGHGGEDAREIRDILEEDMSPLQIAEAHRVASNWQPDH